MVVVAEGDVLVADEVHCVEGDGEGHVFKADAASALMVRASDIGERPLEAARLSPRGGGWAPSGLGLTLVQSRQARPEEAQGASWGTTKEGTLTMSPRWRRAPSSRAAATRTR